MYGFSTDVMWSSYSVVSYLRIIFILNFVIKGISSKCYFPGELQGLWATQVAPARSGKPIIYSSVIIDHNSISTWGTCHSKIDENVILEHKSRRHSSQCYRCFRLVVASVNVASLLSNGLEKCYPTTRAALESCPTQSGLSAHIVLYKMRQVSGNMDFQETQCPLNGVFVFSYERGDRRHKNRDRCAQATSEMSNCRFGFAYNLQYRDCTFDQPESARWHCLGSWEGLDGQKYLAVWDVNSDGDQKPKYKCGIYKEDHRTKTISLSFSKDSTCTNGLFSATDGYERYTLTPASTFPVPRQVETSKCSFDFKYRGHWHNMKVKKNTLQLVNEHTLKVYDMQCLEEKTTDGMYVVYSQEDCDKAFYTCIILKRRASNIIEILIGTKDESSAHDLCHDHRFGNYSHWITLAKQRPSRTHCPIVGSYEGSLPEAEEYCAQMYSDCSRSNIMYYAVDECKNHSSVFEQRSYQCLGEWSDMDGNIYALTRRRDINRYECFVGIRRNGGVVYIMEAGSSCQRGHYPEKHGMKTIAKAECPRQTSRTTERDTEQVNNIRRRPEAARATKATRPPWAPSLVTRDWEPITGRPRTSDASIQLPQMILFSMSLSVFFLV